MHFRKVSIKSMDYYRRMLEKSVQANQRHLMHVTKEMIKAKGTKMYVHEKNRREFYKQILTCSS